MYIGTYLHISPKLNFCPEATYKNLLYWDFCEDPSLCCNMFRLCTGSRVQAIDIELSNSVKKDFWFQVFYENPKSFNFGLFKNFWQEQYFDM